MKIALVYVCVLGKAEPTAVSPDFYWPYAERFAKTYQQFPPGLEHDLHVVGCGIPEQDNWNRMAKLFGSIANKYHTYTGTGYDIGAEQYVAKKLEADFAVFIGAQVHFYRKGWMKPLYGARWRYGEGLYGPFASYEIQPHIRTSCYACDPYLLATFPHTITTKQEGHEFESGAWNFSRYMDQSGCSAKLVTWNDALNYSNWRHPKNGFRSGDQTDCLVFDHHTDMYDAALTEEKAKLERMADGK